MQTEVARARADRARGCDVTDREVLDALDRTRATEQELRALTARLEQLRRYRG